MRAYPLSPPEVRTQHDDPSDVIAVVDKGLPHNGEQGRGALGVVGMRCADLLRETIGWRVCQPRELGNEIADRTIDSFHCSSEERAAFVGQLCDACAG